MATATIVQAGNSGRAVWWDITWSEAVNGFTAADITASHSTTQVYLIGSNGDTEYRYYVWLSNSNVLESFYLTIQEDAVDEGNDEIVFPAQDPVFSATIDDQAWVVGTAASVTLPTASGGQGSVTYSLSSTLPAGVTFDAATRVLSGTPTGRFSSATFTYTATDSQLGTDTLTFTIVVTAPAITIASITNKAWVVGTAASVTLPAGSGGVGTLTPSLSGTLPTGVSFDASTRVLSGTPTGRFSSATFTYTITDSESISESSTFTIVVIAPAITIGTIDDQAWETRQSYRIILPAGSGGVGTLTPSLTGTLPTGVTFDASTRILSGFPTEAFAEQTLTYTITDSESISESTTFTIVVTLSPNLNFGEGVTINNIEWVINTELPDITLPEVTDGTGAITYTLAPTLPTGISFDATTRILSGTPTARFPRASFTYTATDTNGITGTLTFDFIVIDPPRFTEPATPYVVRETESLTIPTSDFFENYTSVSLENDPPLDWVSIQGLNVVINKAVEVVRHTNFNVEISATNQDTTITSPIIVRVEDWIILYSAVIAADSEIYQGQQIELSCVIKDELGDVVTQGLTYSWEKNIGSFIGSTVGPTVKYLADFVNSEKTEVEITVNVIDLNNNSPSFTKNLMAVPYLEEIEIPDSQLYITTEGDTLAGIIYSNYGVSNQEILKLVLDSNPNIVSQQISLPQGIEIILPDIDVSHEITPIALWT